MPWMYPDSADSYLALIRAVDQLVADLEARMLVLGYDELLFLSADPETRAIL